MTSDEDAAAVAYNFDDDARYRFFNHLTRYNGITLDEFGLAEWHATFNRTLGQFLVKTQEKHPRKDVWGSKKVKMLPEFILERIDEIAAALGDKPGTVGADELRVAAASVISSEETRKACAAMLKHYDKALGGTGRKKFPIEGTPICPEGLIDRHQR